MGVVYLPTFSGAGVEARDAFVGLELGFGDLNPWKPRFMDIRKWKHPSANTTPKEKV